MNFRKNEKGGGLEKSHKHFRQKKSEMAFTFSPLVYVLEWTALFPFPPTSHDLQYISETSGFKRLSMKTKYVCRSLISLYVNFHSNRTMLSINLHIKTWRLGGKEKRAEWTNDKT